MIQPDVTFVCEHRKLKGGRQMSTPKSSDMEEEKVSCSVCLKEIPLSAALMPEGGDYIGQFCGIECYEQFASKHKLDPSKKPKKKS
jgi:hypothetical protein